LPDGQWPRYVRASNIAQPGQSKFLELSNRLWESETRPDSRAAAIEPTWPKGRLAIGR